VQLLLLTLTLQLSGCATLGQADDPRDPFESLNRTIYSFNDTVDRAVLVPVAETYIELTPPPVQRGIGNFFHNLADVRSALNNLLQAKVGRSLSDLSRVLINSTLGIAGFFDVASTADIPRYGEDFGQTLGYWGVEPGPYLVLPFLGPSSVRDTGGKIVDWFSEPATYIEHYPTRGALKVLEITDQRAQLLSASTLLEEAALDPYAFLRDAYLQRRLSQVYDGNPPEDFDPSLFQ
jgi:phospholipid-binding lipoprotein MlaA